MIAALAAFALVALADLPPLIRRRSTRGVVAFLLVLVPAMILAFLRLQHIEVPSVMLAIGDFMKALGLSY